LPEYVRSEFGRNNDGVTSTSREWTFVVPLKSTARGKSRLEVPASLRRRLALAMAADTVGAAARCGPVLVVVEDQSDGQALRSIPRVRYHLTAVSGQNESILAGLAVLAAAGRSGYQERIAVLPADLPGLQSSELVAVLERCATHAFSVVADHQGTGTTLLAAVGRSNLRPRYGPDSFRRHQLVGAVPIQLAPGSGLSWDIDTVADLDADVGPSTSAVLAGAPACDRQR